MKATKYFLGLTGTTTDSKNGNRIRFATAAKFGPLDPIVTFCHSQDAIHLCNRYFRVQNPFFRLKQKCGENYHCALAWSPQKGVWPKKGILSACDRLRPPARVGTPDGT